MTNFHSIKDKYFNNYDQLETEASGRIQLLFWDASDQTQGLPRARQVHYLPATNRALGIFETRIPYYSTGWSWTSGPLASVPESWDDRVCTSMPACVWELYQKVLKHVLRLQKTLESPKLFNALVLWSQGISTSRTHVFSNMPSREVFRRWRLPTTASLWL